MNVHGHGAVHEQEPAEAELCEMRYMNMDRVCS